MRQNQKVTHVTHIGKHMNIKKPLVHFIMQNIFDRKWIYDVTGVSHLFSIKNICYDKIGLSLFHFRVTI